MSCKAMSIYNGIILNHDKLLSSVATFDSLKLDLWDMRHSYYHCGLKGVQKSNFVVEKLRWVLLRLEPVRCT